MHGAILHSTIHLCGGVPSYAQGQLYPKTEVEVLWVVMLCSVVVVQRQNTDGLKSSSQWKSWMLWLYLQNIGCRGWHICHTNSVLPPSTPSKALCSTAHMFPL